MDVKVSNGKVSRSRLALDKGACHRRGSNLKEAGGRFSAEEHELHTRLTCVG